MTAPRAQKLVFVWDTWTNKFLIPMESSTGSIPPSWFSLSGPHAEQMPPLGTLTAYLQLFGHLDTEAPNPAPAILGIGCGGDHWRRVRPPAREELALTHIQEEEEAAEEEEVHEDVRCGVCHDKQISVRFRECTHGLCAACNDAYWWSLLATDALQGRDHARTLRLSFPCHMCRAEVYHEGLLAPGSSTSGEVERWFLVALRQGFEFHRVFVVRVGEDESVVAGPLVGGLREAVCVDGELAGGCWDLYVVYALMMLCMTADTMRGEGSVVY